MKLATLVSVVLFGMNAFSAATVSSSDFSCATLKGLVKSEKEINISTALGVYNVHSSSKACYDAGLLASKYVTVQASDRMCVVGFECTVYNY